MSFFKKHILSLLFILTGIIANATHNRAGEILYEKVQGTTNRYKITVLMYTFSTAPGNSPEVEIKFGDGTSDTIPRVSNGPNGKGIPIDNGINLNTYIVEHDYAGATADGFLISVNDFNRTSNIENIQGGATQETAFYVETRLFNNINASRNSPKLLNPPIDKGCVGRSYTHNPGASDIEGDSLSYTIIPSRGINGSEIAGYVFPQTSNVFTIDNSTGDLTWDSPVSEGEYNFAIRIDKWRNGVSAGYVVRDMQVAIDGNCTNLPPVITAPKKICVEAGDAIDFLATATDPNSGDGLNMSHAGLPFSIIGNDASAGLEFPGIDSISKRITWITENIHVRKEPYLITHRAFDLHPTNELTHVTSTQIWVRAPAVENVQASVLGTTSTVSWNATFPDLGTGNNVSYDIYRKIDSTGINVDSCFVGAPPGFSKIGTNLGITNTTYSDSTLKLGVEYCYLIVARYAIDGGQSKPSEQVCVSVKRDVPVITNVTVDSTDSINGQITVKWSKPDIDTVQLQGPHSYHIFKSTDGSAFVFDTLIQGLNDTVYQDVLLNTKDDIHAYRVDYKSGFIDVGSTENAQDINPSLSATDNQLTLTWSEQVPWTNSSYTVFRFDSVTMQFDSLVTTNSQTYLDTGLVNNRTYCYRVRSTGSLNLPGVIDPIINFSKTICDKPIDNIIPCPPVTVSIESDCANLLENKLTWNNPNNDCTDDVLLYNLYYKSSIGAPYQLLQDSIDVNDTNFTDVKIAVGSVAGCYRVTSLDSVGNESTPSVEVCADNCPVYELPTVFTPLDKNGLNDVFHPFDGNHPLAYRQIQSVDIRIFNRWGHLVFEQTGNIDINWDGTHFKSKNQLSEGVYFWVADVHEIRLAGIVTRQIKGYVQIID